ncbi:MAG TPA: hypothetical protein PLV57_22405 [Phycisphaerae bacterium]|nr:hypothetical protein [Phycisphaerae bacterium]HOM53803.1 hypothetical protein [Phycisphaerae bacterium]HON68603.1 hypothetical protein [Phycisphaerae bacterium]HPP29265.1 hypothetical protein [Phycisphaerae bacterium]
MASDQHILTFGGQPVGDYVSHVTMEFVSNNPNVQQGLGRPTAMISDDSPNLYYILRAYVYYKAPNNHMLTAIRWAAQMARLRLRGRQDVVVTPPSGSPLRLPAAAMRGPLVLPDRQDTNVGLVRNLEVVFVSDREPI